MSGFLSALVTVLSVGMLIDGRTHQSPPSPAPLPAELVYDTFCQKDEAARKKLFRTATAEQKSIMTRRQIERWREANVSRLSKTQLTALQELWTMATPAMFEPTDAGRQAMESFERRADAAFSGREMDQLGPYGPCIAKGEIAQTLAAYAAGDASAIARWLDTRRGMGVAGNTAALVTGNAAVPAPVRLAFLLELGMTVPAPFVPPLLRAGRALVAEPGAVDAQVERLWHQGALGVAQHLEQFWLQQELIDATAARIRLNPRLPLARGIAAAGLCCWKRVLPADDGEHVRTFDRADGRFVRGWIGELRKNAP